MSMIATARFVGVVDGQEKTFHPGDTITEAEARELGLKAKPDLAKPGKAPKRGKDAEG